MLHFQLLPERRIIILKPDAPLTSVDFEKLAEAVDPIVASHGKLAGILICADSFPGWMNFPAFTGHLQFVVSHHRKIARIAAMTRSSFIRFLTRIAGAFVSPEIKLFDTGAEDRALAWLEGSDERVQFKN